ncbi:MAG: type IX secretion system membrane protein PorP/SprF [Muribaculaceae bacterium]|nr:type IX secretion system membrane protein PorP/SprF [Muribaculaceae bacterium]
MPVKIKYLVFLILSFIASISAVAQTDAQFTQYWAVQNYYNPAATGNIDYIQIKGGSRMQWVGITNAPSTFLLTADSPFKIMGKKVGAGIVVNQESIGLYKTMNLSAQLSYKIKLFGGTLGLGVQLGFMDETFKGSEVNIPDSPSNSDGDGEDTASRDGSTTSSTDDGLPSTDIHGTAFDVGLGAYYTHKYFWAGISATHLNQPTVSLNTEGNTEQIYEAQVGRTFYFMAGSNIPIKNSLFEIQPSVLVRSNLKITQAEITARLRYKKFISFGVAYRTNDAISAMISAEYKNFFLGYSYDYATSAISKVSNGSHEVFVGYNLKLNLGDKNKNKHKSIRIM